MDTKYINAFQTIKEFVNDVLWSNFQGKKTAPLNLYHRVINFLNDDSSKGAIDVSGINKILSGFRQFLCTYDEHIMNGTLDKIPKGTVIRYGDKQRVYLEIAKYIYLSRENKEVLEEIQGHLMVISTILDPTEAKLSRIEDWESSDAGDFSELGNELGIQLDPNRKEDRFVGNLLHKTKSLQGGGIESLFSSGLLQDMFSGIQNMESDPTAMLDTMEKVVGAMRQASTKNKEPEDSGTAIEHQNSS